MPRLALVLLMFSAACAPVEDDEEDFVEQPESAPVEDGKGDANRTVGDYIGNSCTTNVVLPLAKQVMDRMVCLAPDALRKVEAGSHIAIVGSAVIPYLETGAHDDLMAAATEAGQVRITSGMRTLPQQVLIHNWFERGRCGITAAARPGRSNHETARALDLDNWSAVRGAMGRHGFAHPMPKDPVHFDHLDSPDSRGLDVLAFQQLWNDNHPEDLIDEDGDYGTSTAQRVGLSPAKGFTVSTCRVPVPTPPPTPKETLGDRGFNAERVKDYAN
jgi:hypothetical protein